MTITPILMNDFSRQWDDTRAAVIGAVEAVGESGWYVLGKQVAAFETALARHIECSSVIGCGNGLDAIEIGLRALAIKPGQKVLTTPLSAFATTLAIVRAGGVPVFVDVDEVGLIDLDRVEECLEQDTSIRVLVPVHLFGHALDLDRLATLAERFGVQVLEDCCQAIGARWRGRPVGSAGRIGALSFYPTKNLGSLGDGGAIITNDPALAAHCRSLRDYGQTAKYVHEHLGLNSRLDELHAGILTAAFLPRLTEWTSRRREIARYYLKNIGHPSITTRAPSTNSESVWHLFPLRLPADQRPAFMAYLNTQGIQSGIHYPQLISDQRALSETDFTFHGSLTHALAATVEEVSIPIHPYLSDADLERAVAAINSFQVP